MLINASAPRALPPQLPATERARELRADKGPKDASFDAWFLGAGRRAMEKALKMDRKR
jgi:hypothetical protein